MLLLSAGAARADLPAQVRPIGSRLELLVDRYLIDSMSGTELRLNHPVDAGSVIAFDQPWEGPLSMFCTVIKDGPVYRFYYRGKPKPGLADGRGNPTPFKSRWGTETPDGDDDEITGYAESGDGIHWVKPDLGIFGHNNVILDKTSAPASTDFTPFLDTRPGTPVSQRYKALAGWMYARPRRPAGQMAFASGDGIHWRRLREQPVITKANFLPPAFIVDMSQTPAFWSESEQCYVAYMRTWSDGGSLDGSRGPHPGDYAKTDGIHIRSVGRLTSPDFIHWSQVKMMTYGNIPVEQFYNNDTSPYFRAPHILISYAPRIIFDAPRITPEQTKALDITPNWGLDSSEPVFMTSRGGTTYDRTFLEAAIRNGIGPRNWTSRDHYAALNIVPTGEDEMSLYLDNDYAQKTNHIERYILTTDRFASVHAPFAGGEFTTRPLTFSGRSLWINYSTSIAGAIRVEIEGIDRRPLPGFSLADSVERVGNRIEQAVAWKSGAIAVLEKWKQNDDNNQAQGIIQHTAWAGGDDISRLAGTPIRLRFVMKEADLYALRFR